MNHDELRAILDNPALSAEQKQRLQAVGGDPVGFSDAAMAMLRTLGKNHLIDVTVDQWSQYALHHGVTEATCEEFWSWHCPDDEYLRLLGVSRRWHWERVRDRATSNDVRAHAIKQIADVNSDGEA